ncbi:Protein kinase domain-containing protein [Alteribacillus persepolensis]|uniref:Protein kinase domain-containing protein n=1 Tax=Alteribacillus persepolensis TaxID=568899 RepID=A0A1G8K085_9BACI|nr:protein kinase [Alteribacillus persepolensis]SDI36767.1 Protein kinase domain-containing protein [Alteribacillus persepolensis]
MEAAQWDQYKVDATPKGIGLYGRVYFGYDIYTKQKVAIKQLSNISVAKKEALIMRSYGKFKYLPDFYKFFILGQKGYIVMEKIEGKTIGTCNFYKKGKRRSPEQATRVLIDILKAIHYLHQRGIVHNDLLPKNVMTANDKRANLKVIDFNKAKCTRDIKYRKKDLYQAALMCIYLINGVVPKHAHTFRLPDKQLQRILMNAIRYKYQSAQAFINALKSLRQV